MTKSGVIDYYSMADVKQGCDGQDVAPEEEENEWVLRDPYSDDNDDPNVVKNLSYRKVKDS